MLVNAPEEFLHPDSDASYSSLRAAPKPLAVLLRQEVHWCRRCTYRQSRLRRKNIGRVGVFDMNRLRASVLVTMILSVLFASAVSARADTGHGPGDPIPGNFTLDKYRDQATLGHDPLGCTIKVDRVYNHGFTSTRYFRFSIPTITQPSMCPVMGVAVPTGKAATVDDIVVTWPDTRFSPPARAYILRNFTAVIPSSGEVMPARIGGGDVDFNGDGLKDFWEISSNDAEGLKTYLREGDHFTVGPATLPCPYNGWHCEISAPYTRQGPAFGELDGKPGTDIVTPFITQDVEFGVAFISGTGTERIVELNNRLWTYEVVLIDHNGDGILDVEIKRYNGATLLAIKYYLNDGAGNFTIASS
jgi:hypothetical protein